MELAFIGVWVIVALHAALLWMWTGKDHPINRPAAEQEGGEGWASMRRSPRRPAAAEPGLEPIKEESDAGAPSEGEAGTTQGQETDAATEGAATEAPTEASGGTLGATAGSSTDLGATAGSSTDPGPNTEEGTSREKKNGVL